MGFARYDSQGRVRNNFPISIVSCLRPSAGRGEDGWSCLATRSPSLTRPTEGREQEYSSGSNCGHVPKPATHSDCKSQPRHRNNSQSKKLLIRNWQNGGVEYTSQPSATRASTITTVARPDA